MSVQQQRQPDPQSVTRQVAPQEAVPEQHGAKPRRPKGIDPGRVV